MADAKQQLWGGLMPQMAAWGNFNTFTFNQSTDQIEVIFQAREDATITKLGVRIGGAAANITFKIQLQGVDTSGNADGTILGGGSPASATFNPSSLGWASGGFNWVTLDNTYDVSRGLWYAFVITYVSGTFGSQVFSTAGPQSGMCGVPYLIHNDNGTRSRQSTGGQPIFGYASSTTAYGFPVSAASELAFTSATTPDEYAITFTVPSTFCTTFKLAGVIGLFRPATASSTKMMLFDSDGATLLQTLTIDSDYFQDSTTVRPAMYLASGTLATLNSGSTYRLSFQPQAAVNWRIQVMDVPSASDFDAWPHGQDVYLSSRVDAGAVWTNTTTRRMHAYLILDDITNSAGGTTGGVVIGG